MKTAMKTAKKAVKTKPVHFVILVSLEQGSDGDQYSVPRNIPGRIHRGDTVSYESPDGKVEVEFDKDQDGSGHTSPYVDATGDDLQKVEGGIVLTAVNKGIYFGKCSITRTLPDGSRQKTTWKKENSSKQDGSKQVSSKQVRLESDLESGGNHIVKP